LKRAERVRGALPIVSVVVDLDDFEIAPIRDGQPRAAGPA
jgi:hypothetical protein